MEILHCKGCQTETWDTDGFKDGICDSCWCLLEIERSKWQETARNNGWLTIPFYVQAWFNDDGTIRDSVSYKGMTGDIIL